MKLKIFISPRRSRHILIQFDEITSRNAPNTVRNATFVVQGKFFPGLRELHCGKNPAELTQCRDGAAPLSDSSGRQGGVDSNLTSDICEGAMALCCDNKAAAIIKTRIDKINNEQHSGPERRPRTAAATHLFTMSEAVLNSLDAIVGFETHKSTHWEYHWSRLAGRITRAESCLRDSMIGGTTPPGCTLTRHGRLRCTGQSRRGRARGLPNKCTACEESATRDGAPKNVQFTV